MDNQDTPETEVSGDSVRADVVAAFKKHSAPEEPKAELSAEPEEAPEETPEVKQSRQRDEKGKFAKKTEGELEQPELPGQDKTEEKPVQTSTSNAPPIGWPADAKAQWAQLPPAIQAAVLKREGEISNGGRQWSEEKRRYEEVLAPLRETSKKFGFDEKEGLQRLLRADEFLRTKPAEAIAYLAKAHNVDLTQLPNVPQTQVDPVSHQLRQEVADIKRALTAREEAEAAREIQNFSKDKPYFEEARVYMGHLLSTGAAETIQDAYDQAIWAIPQIREKILAEQQAKAEADRKEKDRVNVERARRGAVSINGSPASNVTTPKTFNTVRDAVVDAYARHAR